jgi:hypothetical protein
MTISYHPPTWVSVIPDMAIALSPQGISEYGSIRLSRFIGKSFPGVGGDDPAQSLRRHVCVYLGRRKRGVAEELLDRPDIHIAVEHMCGEGMP